MIVSITIPDGDVILILDGYCTATNYDGSVSKAQWAKSKLISHIRETAKRGNLLASRTVINNNVDAVVLT